MGKKRRNNLFTQNREFFIETMNKFKALENEQKELIEEAQQNVENAILNMKETMNSEIDDFAKNKSTLHVPCLLKDL